MGLKLSANLTKTFANLSEAIQKEHKRVVREVLLNTHNEIILTSPVDIGVYRANHFLEADTATREAVTETSPSNRIAEAESINIEIKNGKQYIFYNPVAYAEALEAGHSKNNPNGIYAPAAEKMRSLIRKQGFKVKYKVTK